MKVDPLAKDKIQQTSIYYAAREGKLNACKYLLEKGVALNEPDLYHQTPIYYAARY
jgi:ankyrin repeat protein